MSLKKKIFNFFAAALLAVSSVPISISRSASALMDEDMIPGYGKVVEENGDGTYDISLYITGKAKSDIDVTKANVVVVYDTSGSMKYPEPSTEYGRYGYSITDGSDINVNNYVDLYYQSGTDRWGNPTYAQVGDNDNHSTVYTRSWNNWAWDYSYSLYDGPRYSNKNATSTRATVAESALSSLAEKLLSNNDDSNDKTKDVVEMAFVDFSTTVNESTSHTQPTTQLSTFNSWVTAATPKDGINGGTNWEAALTYANNRVTFNNDGDATYIIFISDGNPTFRNTRHCTGRNCQDPDDSNNTPTGIHGSGNSDPQGYNLSDAQAVAADIVNAGKTLYAVGVFGDADNMQDLHSSAIYKDASNQQALNAAFDDIVSKITNNLTISDVIFDDGMTGLADVAVSGNVANFRYRKGIWANTEDESTLKNLPAWNPANDGAGLASFDKATNKVVWDLGEDYVISDGETVVVTFTVYPSQRAFDLLADLENGKISYADLTDTEKQSIKQVGDGYAFQTNTDSPAIHYCVTKTSSNSTTPQKDCSTDPITNSDPKAISATKIGITKIWEAGLDETQIGDYHGQVVLDLGVSTDGGEAEPYETDITLSSDNGWKLGHDISIAPGIMVSENSGAYDAANSIEFGGNNYTILDTGHDYIFTEPDEKNTYVEDGEEKEKGVHFDLVNNEHHPMLIGAEVYDVTFEYGGEDGKTLVGIKSMNPIAELTATNKLKGGIKIEKQVDNNGTIDNTITDKFEFDVYIKDSADTYYRIYDKTTGDRGDKIYFENGHFTEQLTVNQYIIVSDVDHGAYFRVVENESSIPAGYTKEAGEAKIEYDYSIVRYDSDAETGDIISEEFENEQWYQVERNASAQVVVTNFIKTGDLTFTKDFEKISGNLDKAKENASFDFQIDIFEDESKEKTFLSSEFTLSAEDEWIKTFEKIPAGFYYEITEKTDNLAGGFSVKNETATVTGTIEKGSENSASITNEYKATGKATVVVNKLFGSLDGTTFWNYQDDFIFTLKDASGATVESKEIDPVSHYATFEIPVLDEGSYTYQISEDSSNFKPGVQQSSDGEIVKVSFTATDENGDGTLQITAPIYENQKDTIYNEYVTEGTLEDAFELEKVISGRDWQSGDEFTFVLSGSEGAPMPANTTVKVSGEAGSSAAVAFDFGTIDFSETNIPEEGIKYTYTITESEVNLPGITIAGPVVIEVFVQDGKDGTLNITVSDYEKTVTNLYAANGTTGEADFEFTKVLEGRDWNENDVFSFTIAGSEGAPMPEDTTPRTATESTPAFNFETISYTEADAGKTYTYTISESAVGDTRITKAEDLTVTVEITDNGDGTLGVNVVAENGKVFTNVYNPPYTDEEDFRKAVKIYKEIEDKSESYTYDETFTFKIKADESEFETTATISAEAAKAGELATILSGDVFNKAGTYTYTVSEVAGETPGMTYDASEKTLTVVVEYDAQKGEFYIASASEIFFKNIYEPTPVIVNDESSETWIIFTKETPGYDEDAERKTFTFELKDSEGTVIATATTAGAESAVKFSEKLTFSKVGNYDYTISEVAGNEPGFEYDLVTRDITIIVTDDGNGKLKAEVSGNNPTFTNTYTATGTYGAEGELEFTKIVLNQDEWEENYEFGFQLYEIVESEDGEELALISESTATKDKQTFSFAALEFDLTMLGEHTYVILETPFDIENVSQVTEYILFTLTVSDNYDGTLNIEASDYDNVFYNNYDEPGRGELEPTVTPNTGRFTKAEDGAEEQNLFGTIAAMVALGAAAYLVIASKRKV